MSCAHNYYSRDILSVLVINTVEETSSLHQSAEESLRELFVWGALEHPWVSEPDQSVYTEILVFMLLSEHDPSRESLRGQWVRFQNTISWMQACQRNSRFNEVMTSLTNWLASQSSSSCLGLAVWCLWLLIKRDISAGQSLWCIFSILSVWLIVQIWMPDDS